MSNPLMTDNRPLSSITPLGAVAGLVREGCCDEGCAKCDALVIRYGDGALYFWGGAIMADADVWAAGWRLKEVIFPGERPRTKEDKAARLCPTCWGERRLHAYVTGRHADGGTWGKHSLVDCVTCAGAGHISSERFAWCTAGKAHRIGRVARGESPQAAARRLGLTHSTLNEMEHGRMDPAPLLVRGSAP